MKYRKKSLAVEAMQFTDKTKLEVFNWAVEKQINIYPSCEIQADEKTGDAIITDIPCLIVPSLSGKIVCHFGDWLIAEPYPTDWRKIRVCRDSIFKEDYEIVEEGEKI